MPATDTVPSITPDQVVEITRDIWSSFLRLDLDAVPDPGGPLGPDTVTGVVDITGAWQGKVLVETTRSHARVAAARMFAVESSSLDEAEVGDALGELTNMVGGNVKGLLLVLTRLSLPSVLDGSPAEAEPDPSPVAKVRLAGPVGPVRITVQRSAA